MKNKIQQAWFYCLLMASLVWPATSYASTGGSTIGSVIHYVTTNTASVLASFISVLSFLLGMYLIASGAMSMYEASDLNQGQASYKQAIIKLIAGSLLCALFTTLDTAVQTILTVEVFGGGTGAQIGAVQDCMTSTGHVPMTCVLKNIAVNVVPAALDATFIFCWIMALGLVMTVVFDFANSQRGQGPKPGWVLKLIAAGILGNFPFFLETIAQTIGIANGTVTTGGYQGLQGGNVSSILAYSSGSLPGNLSSYTQAINWAFVIMSMFGIFYALFGISILMNPNSKHGKADAAWHIFGGVALANPNYSVCLLVHTLMGFKLGVC